MKKEEAFKIAHDIRKFEIELYWKRTTYFWAFIASSFLAYFSLLSSEKVIDKILYLFLVETIGFIFSFGWYLVNRASKHWQLNWEKVIDQLEDDITGPLMKTHIKNDNKWYQLTLSYKFSVSRINQIISLFIVCIWIIFSIQTLIDIYNNYSINLSGNWIFPLSLVSLFVFIFTLCKYGQSGSSEEKVKLEDIHKIIKEKQT